MEFRLGSNASSVIDGKIWVVGGFLVTSPLYQSIGSETIEVYDPETNTWDTSKTPMPTKRGYTAVGAIGKKIYVCGGRTFAPTSNEYNILEVC